ncbi:MAG: hypothetical protein LBB19_04220 [Puniceicoccales bacterium]|nr:hypothetical protein [Puniceicoccales bacterium]
MYVWRNYDLFHIALDHEGYYYPKDLAKFHSQYKMDYFSVTLKDVIGQVTRLVYGNLQHLWLFSKIRSFFGDHFYLSLFSTGLLMISLSLWGLFFFYQALQFLGASQRFTRICFYTFWLVAPRFFLSCPLPLTSTFCLFAQSLFLWMLVKRNLFGILGSLTLCFLAQKHYYGSFVCCLLCSFILLKFPKNVFLLIFISGVLFHWFHAKGHLEYFFKAKILNRGPLWFRSLGNSYIPDNGSSLKRIGNAWFAPMITNSEQFFHKAPQGSKLGWIYAVKTNIFFLTMMLYIMYLCIKNRKYFRREQIQQIVMLLVFLLAYTITGCEAFNYLNLNRHSEAFIPVWLVLLGLLYYAKAPSLDKHKNP